MTDEPRCPNCGGPLDTGGMCWQEGCAMRFQSPTHGTEGQREEPGEVCGCPEGLCYHADLPEGKRCRRSASINAPAPEAEPAGVTEGELLPCPFCGGEAESYDATMDACHPEWRVGCSKCGAHIFMDQEDEAIAAWNHRPAPPVEREPIERVRNILKEIESVRQQVDTQEWDDVDDELWTAHRHLVTAHAILAAPTKEES